MVHFHASIINAQCKNLYKTSSHPKQFEVLCKFQVPFFRHCPIFLVIYHFRRFHFATSFLQNLGSRGFCASGGNSQVLPALTVPGIRPCAQSSATRRAEIPHNSAACFVVKNSIEHPSTFQISTKYYILLSEYRQDTFSYSSIEISLSGRQAYSLIMRRIFCGWPP